MLHHIRASANKILKRTKVCGRRLSARYEWVGQVEWSGNREVMSVIQKSVG